MDMRNFAVAWVRFARRSWVHGSSPATWLPEPVPGAPSRLRSAARSCAGPRLSKMEQQSRLGAFLRCDQGTLTTEFVLWVPIIMAMLIIVVDTTTIYLTHTEMWNVARDTARRMVTGSVMTEAQAEAYAANAMRLRQNYNYYIEVHYEEGARAEVIIRFAVADMSILGYGSPLTLFGGTMWARVVMRPAPSTEFGSTSGSG